jgi:hypothetical protein
MVKVFAIIGLVIYVGLLVELIMGWSPKQDKKFYRKLFKAKIYFPMLLLSALLLIKPVMDYMKVKQFTLPLLAIPFVYLIFFQMANGMSHLINKRNIIITGKKDDWPKDHQISDSLLHFAATILAIAVPCALSYYIDIKNFGTQQFYYLDLPNAKP